MTSLQFFDHSSIESRPAVDWGTLDLQSEKFDPTIIKAPTFILKNQPITQFYRESNIELSNVRTNDQLMLAPFKENLLEKKILKKFPMEHPFTSQISYKALFPNFTAPEDSKRGEVALNSKVFLQKQTPAQVPPTIVNQKNSGMPWRHEIQYPSLPTQQAGVWYNDKELYHLPKPSYAQQQYYPAPPTLLTPNPRLRASHPIDARTANTLKNKEKELMQSSQRIDYYKDGLGTRAVVNSDDLDERKKRFLETGDRSEEMKPYFRKGAGITANSLDVEMISKESTNPELLHHSQSENYKPVLTKVEQDQILIEHGNNYKNFPEKNYQNNPQVATFNKIEFNRSKTMPVISRSTGDLASLRRSKGPANKLDAEKLKIQQEYHDRIQNLEYENRRNEIENIKSHNDINVLRQQSKALENSRSAHPNLKQNIKPHVNTLYDQERKFLGERAELYKPNTYNPHLLKQYVESVQNDSKISATLSNGSAYPSQKDVHIINDNHEHRPKLFADKAYTDYQNIKRAPLENILKNPNLSAEPVLQENGLIQQQTTYGQSYSTKKYLQENSLVLSGNSHMNLEYAKLNQAELDHQNITLKSRADNIALKEYQMGNTNVPRDMMKADQIIDKLDAESKETEYPRYAGPIPPEPYEPLYCNTQITEMSDGNSKRDYLRVYDSPYVKPTNKYEPLKTDLEAMKNYEQKALNEMVKRDEFNRIVHEKAMSDSKVRITHIDKSQDLTARRALDKITELRQEQAPVSNYQISHSNYYFDTQKPCPPNEYYKNIHYTQDPSVDARLSSVSLPKDLVHLQDSWSKTLAQKNYHEANPGGLADLRENIHTGKKIIYDAPANAYRFA
ncbi:unnamed protein product [Brachionus calyciflorus]|uniref:Uncharacterized protein n=1 Tax=Brachionus calyciflorus TaxID=104777 RepID=A0A813N5R0_9BILA|nr:unnamed protein product [Brachionus calyciflorus]